MEGKVGKDLKVIKKHWEDPAAVSLKDKNLKELEEFYICEILGSLGKIDSLADIGCGDASATLQWARYAKKVFGYDYSAAMVEKAKQIVKGNIELSQFDLLKDKLENKFDVVLTKRCLINLGNFGNQKKAIRDISESIKDEGYYLMLECALEGLNNLNSMRKAMGLELIEEPFHNSYFSIDALKGFLREYFEIKKTYFFSTYYFLTRVYNQVLDKGNFQKFDETAKKFHLNFDIFGSDIIGPQFLMVLKRKP